MRSEDARREHGGGEASGERRKLSRLDETRAEGLGRCNCAGQFRDWFFVGRVQRDAVLGEYLDAR